MSRALAGIEDQTIRFVIDDGAVVVAVKDNAHAILWDVGWIVDYGDRDAVENDRPRPVCEIKTEFSAGCFQRFAFEIVVAEDATQWCAQSGEGMQGLCLGDVACVDRVFEFAAIEYLDNAFDVCEMVVGVADDADAHPLRPPRRFFEIRPFPGRESRRRCPGRSHE